MPYLTKANDIRSLIDKYVQARTLWLDTEVADYKSQVPRLSLIQVLADYRDLSGDRTYILDVLDQPELAEAFINQIMVNPHIEKVFHKASYDLKFLGGDQASNVTCTWKMANKIPHYVLPLPNRQLKTLAEKFCPITFVDKEEQGGDWGKRPLTKKQLQYAKMEPVYVAQVHHHLRELTQQSSPDPVIEDLTVLGEHYQEIEEQWKPLDSEITHLKERIKKVMQVQELAETSHFKLVSSPPTLKVDFAQLANLTQSLGIDLDFSIRITKEIEEELGRLMEQPSLKIEKVTNWRLTPKGQKRSRESTKLKTPDPATEDLTELDERYQEIQPHWKTLDSEINHLKERVKSAMQVQNLSETPHFKLASSTPTLRVNFAPLAKLTHSLEIDLEFPVTLTKDIQKKLGEAIHKLSVQVEESSSWRLIPKSLEDSDEEEW